MRYFIICLILAFLGAGVFLFWPGGKTMEVDLSRYQTASLVAPEIPEGEMNNGNNAESFKTNQFVNSDIEPQSPIANPPKTIKAIYATSWSAGSPKRIDNLINLINETELNAVVIDIKDFSGHIAYNIELPEVEEYRAKEIRIPRVNVLLKKLHDNGIYAIARLTVFQDPILAKARPDLAIKNKKTGEIWLDHKNLAWIDPSAKEAWDYNLAIAKDALSRGFDEINFDYIRFPSDGELSNMSYPFWDEKTPKRKVLKSFFQYLRENLADAKISADVFGLTTVNKDDMGIGQVIEDIYGSFDYVSPMVYPSHYHKQFLGYANPASHPYEVIKYSMEAALKRLTAYSLRLTAVSTTTISLEQFNNTTLQQLNNAKLRPWLQDFSLSVRYDAEMVKKEIQAVYDSASSTPELVNGWMLWSPSNMYTREALNNE